METVIEEDGSGPPNVSSTGNATGGTWRSDGRGGEAVYKTPEKGILSMRSRVPVEGRSMWAGSRTNLGYSGFFYRWFVGGFVWYERFTGVSVSNKRGLAKQCGGINSVVDRLKFGSKYKDGYAGPRRVITRGHVRGRW